MKTQVGRVLGLNAESFDIDTCSEGWTEPAPAYDPW